MKTYMIGGKEKRQTWFQAGIGLAVFISILIKVNNIFYITGAFILLVLFSAYEIWNLFYSTYLTISEGGIKINKLELSWNRILSFKSIDSELIEIETDEFNISKYFKISFDSKYEKEIIEEFRNNCTEIQKKI